MSGPPVEHQWFLAPSFIEKLWAGVDRRGPDECWPWKRGRTGKHGPRETRGGYGQIRFDGKMRYTHIAVRAITDQQAVPDGMVVRHTCNNPPCCNPAHLVIGTVRENLQDAIDAGTARLSHPGETHPRAKLSDADVDRIRAEYPNRSDGVRSMAKRYGISHGQLVKIATGVVR